MVWVYEECISNFWLKATFKQYLKNPRPRGLKPKELWQFLDNSILKLEKVVTKLSLHIYFRMMTFLKFGVESLAVKKKKRNEKDMINVKICTYFRWYIPKKIRTMCKQYVTIVYLCFYFLIKVLTSDIKLCRIRILGSNFIFCYAFVFALIWFFTLGNLQLT